MWNILDQSLPLLSHHCSDLQFYSGSRGNFLQSFIPSPHQGFAGVTISWHSDDAWWLAMILKRDVITLSGPLCQKGVLFYNVTELKSRLATCPLHPKEQGLYPAKLLIMKADFSVSGLLFLFLGSKSDPCTCWLMLTNQGNCCLLESPFNGELTARTMHLFAACRGCGEHLSSEQLLVKRGFRLWLILRTGKKRHVQT